MAGVTVRGGPGELVLAGGICRRAGGLPLALELVASRLRVASLAELAEGLGASGWPARATGAGRHDSLDACLSWSHALLSADAAVVFRRLSVFPGGFDLAAAREVAGARPAGPGPVGAAGRAAGHRVVAGGGHERDQDPVPLPRAGTPVRRGTPGRGRGRGPGPVASRPCVPGPGRGSRAAAVRAAGRAAVRPARVRPARS